VVNVNHLTDIIVIQAHGFTHDLRFAVLLVSVQQVEPNQASVC
jgi:hypothetical protein